jgi:hypothetical protein
MININLYRAEGDASDGGPVSRLHATQGTHGHDLLDGPVRAKLSPAENLCCNPAHFKTFSLQVRRLLDGRRDSDRRTAGQYQDVYRSNHVRTSFTSVGNKADRVGPPEPVGFTHADSHASRALYYVPCGSGGWSSGYFPNTVEFIPHQSKRCLGEGCNITLMTAFVFTESGIKKCHLTLSTQGVRFFIVQPLHGHDAHGRLRPRPESAGNRAG